MKPANLALRRLCAQFLSTKASSPENVVERLGAVQAQDYYGALWAFGLRTKSASRRDVERAIADRKIVRTWPMRGTLHFVTANDARWMIELLSTRPVKASKARLTSLGIDAELLQRSKRVLVKHLKGGNRLSRATIYRLLTQAKIEASEQRGLHILWSLAQQCELVEASRDGKTTMYALFEEWLPDARSKPRDASLAEIARRYFLGHGPATINDFAWWSGLSKADARQALSLVGGTLDRDEMEGETYYSVSLPENATIRSSPNAFFLPPFDELFVGYADRQAMLSKKVALGPFQILGPLVLYKSEILATWKRNGPIDPLRRLTPMEKRAVDAAARRHATFIATIPSRSMRS